MTSIDTENVEIIGEWAFEQCRGLVEVKLHDGLKEIRRQAFNNCISLTLIDIPGSVTDLGKIQKYLRHSMKVGCLKTVRT